MNLSFMFLFSARPDRDAEFPGHSMPKKEHLRYFPFGGWSLVSGQHEIKFVPVSEMV